MNKVEGGQITSVHPPDEAIKITSHTIASPYKDNSQVKTSNQILPSHLSAIIEQNNCTNLHLKTISNQTERIENTLSKILHNTHQEIKKGKEIIEIEPLMIKPKSIAKSINLEKNLLIYQLNPISFLLNWKKN